MFGCDLKYGGESGIRTHVTLSSKHAFQACAFSHSAISPFFYVPNAFELLYTRLRGISGTNHAGSAYRGGRDRYGRLVLVGRSTKLTRKSRRWFPHVSICRELPISSSVRKAQQLQLRTELKRVNALRPRQLDR